MLAYPLIPDSPLRLLQASWKPVKSTLTPKHLALTAVIALAASLDLYKLGFQPFWYDESLSSAVASSHGTTFLELAFGTEASMAFYYLALHIWLMLVPATDCTIRLLSALFAVAAVPALYLVATRLFDRRVGFATALLLAVNPFFLSYAHEARSYTLTVFLSLVSWLLLLKFCQNLLHLYLVAYAFVTTLAIYSHNLTMLMLPAQLTAAICVRCHRTELIRVVGAMIAVCMFSLPLFVLLASRRYAAPTEWIASGIGRPGLGSLRQVAVAFVGGIAPPRIRQRLVEVLFALGFCLYMRQAVSAVLKRHPEAGRYLCGAVAFAIPIALLWSISQIVPTFIVRYVIFCLPFLLLMVAAGWLRSCSGALASAGLASLVVLSIWSDQSYYLNLDKPDWETAIRSISNNAQKGDPVIFAPAGGRLDFEHNLKRFGGEDLQLRTAYPRWNSRFEIGGHYCGTIADLTAALNAKYERLWIVQIHLTGDATERSLSRVFARYPIVARKEFRGISVYFLGRWPFSECHSTQARQLPSYGRGGASAWPLDRFSGSSGGQHRCPADVR